MLQKAITKLLGDKNEKVLKTLYPIVEHVNAIEERYQEEIKTDEDILKKTEEFRRRLSEGESLDDIMPEAFALVKNACRRLLGTEWSVRGTPTKWEMVPYDVQILGGITMHQGNIAEMKTGEGKTLVCTMPVYLNALEGKGSYVVTVNDYLATRDAEWMGGLYKYLGLKVGTVHHGQSKEEKKEAYECDIVYGTNNEFGFDYLRDNMVTDPEEIVQKELNYCIVDEVDSILIDEARTPLIISAPAEESTAKYKKYSRLVTQLQEGSHYEIDEKMKTATLTDEGIKKMEELLGMDNIYTEAGFSEVHHLEQALRAMTCYKKDTDYLVKDNEVLIIDEFTGRLMPGRRYSHGLHQSIEAKENVEVKRESRTLATITFQNYFRMFNKLAGMTGTAKTEEEEFYQIYGLDVIIIPTNKPNQRNDKKDLIFKNQQGKYMAAAKHIKELNDKGQPVLVGTISVERSELMSKLLTKLAVKHTILNAKNHEKEADIVKDAGRKGGVTIATNMAGRGTDIKIDSEVKELGGLFVLGTERHESRRIDNQLRGRSGRQGDPGTSQFFVSMEDDLLRLFGGERIQKMMEMLKVPEEMPIENKMLSNSIESAQKKVEGHHFDVRKHVLQYDDVMNVHRDIIYTRRRKFLESEDMKEDIVKMIDEEAEVVVLNQTLGRENKEWDLEKIADLLKAIPKESRDPLTKESLEEITDEKALAEKGQKFLRDTYEEMEASLPEPDMMRKVEKSIFLRANDTLWMEHIDDMQSLRESVSMRGYGQRDPVTEYKSEGYIKFEEMIAMIRSNTVNTLFKIEIQKAVPRQMLQRSEIKNLQTNEAEVESTITKANLQNPAINSQPRPQAQGVTHAAVTAEDDEPTKAEVKVIKVNADEEDPKETPQIQTQPQQTTTEKVGRNDPCPCGSGKKYKKCCGKNV
ncbi:preprotein translocase subunit SecA [Candidatus Peregrinibacteria bacterium]|jgi:preprotein translocase subunit SecA|nr:preprotein translocase subunit SecA [Candidatus Peregrinibacteria bacterium]MBT4148432.1 preprotein translocase subunit SecA [Candidatus Peregrinibacteria bacterium]MBT4456588.1 preprotein translocase subunit SecA [Candidatus Peregrinibacteria bacterium]